MADAVQTYLLASLVVAAVFGTWFGLWCWRDDLNRKPVLDGRDYATLAGASLVVAGFFFVCWPLFLLIIVAVLGGRMIRAV
ncbi:MAG TPA: hypothetical protein VEA15_09550 [Caulobacteraceae bacterium]|nr:hypothetical protein [Caulobacteraceae bacterium]